MFYRGFFIRALSALLILFLLAVGGFAIHRAGIAQGYALGVATAGAEAGTLPEGVPNQVPPMLYRGYGWGYGPGFGYGFHPFGGFGFIFPLFFGLLFFFFITRLIFRPMFGWGWGGPQEHWRHHGGPPWAKSDKSESKGEEKTAETPEG